MRCDYSTAHEVANLNGSVVSKAETIFNMALTSSEMP